MNHESACKWVTKKCWDRGNPREVSPLSHAGHPGFKQCKNRFRKGSKPLTHRENTIKVMVKQFIYFFNKKLAGDHSQHKAISILNFYLALHDKR
jgi:hypothetical protein